MKIKNPNNTNSDKANGLLYYPYINLPRTDWTLRTLLYYDSVGSIVPQQYFYDPEENYDEFMLELVKNELVIPIDPMQVLHNPWNSMRPFIDYVRANQEKLRSRFVVLGDRTVYKDELLNARVHVDKFAMGVFEALEEMGLAKRAPDNWYSMEKRTADLLMKFLAKLVSARTNRLATTDYVRPYYSKRTYGSEERKRETILTSLIPFPEDINLSKLQKFKDKHSGLLKSFRNRVELIVLDPSIKEDTPLFAENLLELRLRKEELSAKMNESNFSKILFGTVCGLIGAGVGVAAASNNTGFLYGLPGFAAAVHSALQIEGAENVYDQSGLKYLALMDKKLKFR